MTLPLIGITTKRYTNAYKLPEIAVMETYVQAVSQAGGMPVLVPLGLSDELIPGILAKLDGLLLSGGGDIETNRYQADSTPKVDGVDPDRDRVEIELLRAAVSAGLPFFGICRGVQVVNVALGGTLYTDIAEEHPNSIKHDYYPDLPFDKLSHTVTIQKDSPLARIINSTEAEVNSLHHQAIKQLAPDLQEIAHAPDGIIEGVVLPDHPFGLGVQWHPECLTAHEPMLNLFRAFVDAAAKSAGERTQ